MSNTLTPTALADALAVSDLTDPRNGVHAVQLLVDDARRALSDRWRCEASVVRRSPVVAISDNYDALAIPPDAASRSPRYARYVSTTTMLRSHTSALVPPALRELAGGPQAPDVLLVCPGMVHRRDVIDRLHSGTPHMVDLWRVAREGALAHPLGADDLYEMIDVVVEALLPGSKRRTEPRMHPYTQHGLQIDVRYGGRWVEVGECGVAAPGVLHAAGLSGASGLAMGLGLDRLLMIRKGMDDIRLLRSRDPRVVAQLGDLAPYRPVSAQPAVTRDLSLAVDDAIDDEALGDEVRAALGERAELVESVEILAATPYGDLPPIAIDRLGIKTGQKNVLVRIVLRALDRSLTDVEANDLRDHLLVTLHRGSRLNTS